MTFPNIDERLVRIRFVPSFQPLKQVWMFVKNKLQSEFYISVNTFTFLQVHKRNYLGLDESSGIDDSEFKVSWCSISNLGLVGSNIWGADIFPCVLAMFSLFAIGFFVTTTFLLCLIDDLLPAEIFHNRHNITINYLVLLSFDKFMSRTFIKVHFRFPKKFQKCWQSL